MAEINERPIVFALSNPTSQAECTARQAYEWSDCRAIYASGSPFDPVTMDGCTMVPGQGNNSYVFPGIGLGVLASRSSRVTDDMFFAAASNLASQVDGSSLQLGRVYPALSDIQAVSLNISVAVFRPQPSRLRSVPMRRITAAWQSVPRFLEPTSRPFRLKIATEVFKTVQPKQATRTRSDPAGGSDHTNRLASLDPKPTRHTRLRGGHSEATAVRKGSGVGVRRSDWRRNRPWLGPSAPD